MWERLVFCCLLFVEVVFGFFGYLSLGKGIIGLVYSKFLRIVIIFIAFIKR